MNGFSPLSRRDLLKTTSAGFGYLALAGMCADDAMAAVDPSKGNPGPFPIRDPLRDPMIGTRASLAGGGCPFCPPQKSAIS